MVIKITNLDKLLNKFNKPPKLDIESDIKKATRKVQSSAKDLVPVDTGILKNSIKTDFDEDRREGRIYTSVEYAPHVEYGTRKMKGKAFLRPAFNLNKQQIKKDLENAMKRELKKLQ